MSYEVQIRGHRRDETVLIPARVEMSAAERWDSSFSDRSHAPWDLTFGVNVHSLQERWQERLKLELYPTSESSNNLLNCLRRIAPVSTIVPDSRGGSVNPEPFTDLSKKLWEKNLVGFEVLNIRVTLGKFPLLIVISHRRLRLLPPFPRATLRTATTIS